MRSFFVAAALGLGLLTAGATMHNAAAAPFPERALAGTAEAITPVHYRPAPHRHGYYRPHYVPPRHRWHRPAPPPPHAWRHPAPQRYGSRY